MYLSREDILKIIQDLKIRTSNLDHPFDIDKQVKVCSIDLRVDNQFWREKKYFKSIDLSGSKTLEISPRRLWKKNILNDNHSITIKPGEYILGRTYEEFEIPKKFAGKIITRSSYSRLGLETSFTCDFINPGWRGKVPIELKNNSKNSIRIYPYLPLVQIFLIPLTSEPQIDYSDKKAFKSKYMNDDGGPSFWWRDDMIEYLYLKVHGKEISEELASSIISLFSDIDDFGIYRLDKLINSLSPSELTNIEDLKDLFRKSEIKKRNWNRLRNSIFYGGFPSLLLTSIGVFFERPITKWHWVLWLICMLSVLPFIYQTFYSEKKTYYTK